MLRLFVENTDGSVKVGGSLDPGHPHAGKLRQASFILPRGMDGQKMKIRAEIETKGGIRRPLHWASAQPANSDGSLTIELLRSDDKKWRKGV